MGAASLRILPTERISAARAGADLGRLMNAAEVSLFVCGEKFEPKWVIQKMAPRIGTKPGKEWLFYEAEARELFAEILEKARRGR